LRQDGRMTTVGATLAVALSEFTHVSLRAGTRPAPTDKPQYGYAFIKSRRKTCPYIMVCGNLGFPCLYPNFADWCECITGFVAFRHRRG